MKIYSVADYIISPLGLGAEENLHQLENGCTAIQQQNIPAIPEEKSVFAATFPNNLVQPFFTSEELKSYTSLELCFILATKKILEETLLSDFSRLLLVISSTKGNIELLGEENPHIPKKRLFMPEMAKAVSQYFDFPNSPMVVSNACISGISGLLIGQKMIKKGHYDHALVLGGDSFSHFVYAGFQSFMALSSSFCAPYDKNRDGINLGEAVTGILLSKDKSLCKDKNTLGELVGGGQANDANHISGPSREGKGLKIAVSKAMEQAEITPEKIGYINAHGTATPYNDEMEAIAFSSLGLEKAPLNSLKGYFGHTLGAAGVLESSLAIRQLNSGILLQNKGFEEMGVSKSINILEENLPKGGIEYILKTASGFGGGNAAVIFKKA
ncbi:beta-ketoacyl synthase N-terminal-like domain-containing protein [Flammeovirgaceae bacterium SG7u.111]|nr:beta-ketoacyl synthase N-terminal-like domain-containing protein [Flammeovirgaceae bacterium SG7u.132]WPO36162.1 beta-ketoacyl synthase N-terminal-like domain-containing protein [Flammeovirgaceae bacterium SG7u.111]